MPYEREKPGDLMHVQMKKLGRIPDGGGHRTWAGRRATRTGRAACAYLHSAIGDHSRVAYSEIHTAFAEHYSVEGLTLLTAEPTVLHSDPDAVQTVAYCSSRLSAVVY